MDGNAQSSVAEQRGTVCRNYRATVKRSHHYAMVMLRICRRGTPIVEGVVSGHKAP